MSSESEEGEYEEEEEEMEDEEEEEENEQQMYHDEKVRETFVEQQHRSNFKHLA